MTSQQKRATRADEKTLRSIDDLTQTGLVSASEYDSLQAVARLYDIAITPEMAGLIQHKGDPIARQFVPSIQELKILPYERQDPIGDYVHSPLKALVHRHRDRVLLKPTPICAVYCRFCFRREMVGADGDSVTQQDIDAAIDYIAAHREISEVILTGGDPLVLAPKKLQVLMQRLADIPHVQWLRLHSRVPIVAPDRINDVLIQAMEVGKSVIMAVHMNHAREMTAKAMQAVEKLSRAGVPLLGQSVLLNGVNNNVDALADLFTTMMRHRIKPYYLHHPDMTVGTSHFRLTLAEGMRLMNELRRRVSGLCIPQYTLDIPGGVAKIPVSSDHVRPHPTLKNTYLLMDIEGGSHLYYDIPS